MAIGECYAGLDTPGTEVLGMNGFSGVMLGKSFFEVFREARVEAVRVFFAGEDVDVLEFHGCSLVLRRGGPSSLCFDAAFFAFGEKWRRGRDSNSRGPLQTPHAFQACALDHSATPPMAEGDELYSEGGGSGNCCNNHSSSSGLRSKRSAVCSRASSLVMPGVSLIRMFNQSSALARFSASALFMLAFPCLPRAAIGRGRQGRGPAVPAVRTISRPHPGCPNRATGRRRFGPAARWWWQCPGRQPLCLRGVTCPRAREVLPCSRIIQLVHEVRNA